MIPAAPEQGRPDQATPDDRRIEPLIPQSELLNPGRPGPGSKLANKSSSDVEAGQPQRNGEHHETPGGKVDRSCDCSRSRSNMVANISRSMKQSVIGKTRSIYSKSISSTMPEGPARSIRPNRSFERPTRSHPHSLPTASADSGPASGSSISRTSTFLSAEVGDFNLVTTGFACHGSDRLAVEDERDESLRPGPFATTRPVGLVQRWAAEPASQDEPPGSIGTPPDRQGRAVGPRTRAIPPLDMPSHREAGSDVRSPIPSPPVRPDESHTSCSEGIAPGHDAKTTRVIELQVSCVALVWSSMRRTHYSRDFPETIGVVSRSPRMMFDRPPGSSLTRRE